MFAQCTREIRYRVYKKLQNTVENATLKDIRYIHYIAYEESEGQQSVQSYRLAFQLWFWLCDFIISYLHIKIAFTS